MAGETTNTAQKKADKADLDSPWKYALEYYFRDFMEYCLPHIAAQIDWNTKTEFLDKELAQSHNRFAIIILAQLAVLETQNQPRVRLKAKIILTCKLYEKNWERQDILQLYTLIDWIITLPEELVLEYNSEIKQIEEERKVNYITTAERIGRQEGLREGFQQGLLKGESILLTRLLKLRFKHIPNKYLALIQQADNETFTIWSERILYAETLQEIFN